MTQFYIENHTVHLWRVLLTDFIAQENQFLKLLSQDEIQRANRFRFPQHRTRFILARGILREVLSQYIEVESSVITFEYGPRGKPYLSENSFNLQFNVSHSEDVAVFALTKEFEIGVDIQKIEKKYQESVAKRFFSSEEYAALQRLPKDTRSSAFYELWAAKEALIKAVGEGLYVPLGNFSVALHQTAQWIVLTHEKQTQNYYLKNFDAFSEYQSAFATSQDIKNIIYWEWTLEGPSTY